MLKNILNGKDILAVLINPNDWDLLGPSILVRRYEKPERIGRILTPIESHYRFDASWTLWEVVKSCEMADEFLGYKLIVDDILTTLRRIPPNIGISPEGIELFVMGLNDDLIRGITRWRSLQ